MAGGQSLSQQLRAESGEPLWTGHHSIVGYIMYTTLSQTAGSIHTALHITCTSWGVIGNQSTRRNPTQTWGEGANSAQTAALAGIGFFVLTNIVMKQCLMKEVI